MKKFVYFLLAIILIFSVSISALALGGGEITPYYVPTISTTQCPNCKNQMTFVAEIPEWSWTVVNSCEVTSVSHEHYFKHYYSHYACAPCGLNGRIFTRTTMQCSVSENDYSLPHANIGVG